MTSLIAGVTLALAVAAMLANAQESNGDGQKGGVVFEKMQCFTCHPGGGNLINPSRPLKGKAFNKKFPEDGRITDIIRNGNPGTAMPAYSTDRLSDPDLNDLIAYIRSLTPATKKR
jgi:mono/diheme cytochrome c family protein